VPSEISIESKLTYIEPAGTSILPEGSPDQMEEKPAKIPQEVLPKIVSCSDAEDLVEIDNLEFFVFVAFLRYLYTDQVKAPLHHVPKLIVLANLYNLPRMAIICKRLLIFKEAPIWGGDQSSLPQEVVPPSTFAQDLTTAINSPNYSDINFTLADDTIVFAHKMILAARSDYFRTIFEGSFRESVQTRINMKEIESSIFLALLRFMYTDEIADTDDHMVEVLIASGRFLLDDLKQRIEKHLESQLEPENTVDLLFLGESTNTPKLRKACIASLVENLPKLKSGLQDLSLNSPATVKHVEFLYRKKYDPNFNVNDLLRTMNVRV